MDVEDELANGLLESHPTEAAQSLERMPPGDVAALFSKAQPGMAAGVLRQMPPPTGAAILAELDRERACEIVSELPVEAAALCLRAAAPSCREALLEGLPRTRARALTSLLRFPEHSAGSLMDPDALALPQDLSAKEALARIRKGAENAHYNLYVVDRDHVLAGVVNLRELLLAPPAAPLSSFMQRRVRALPARADRHAIVSDPAWREAHALPVVDERGLYVGAIRYRTLRRLEEELHGSQPEQGATARALGDLFRTGAAGMLEVMAASAPTRRPPEEPRRSRDGT